MTSHIFDCSRLGTPTESAISATDRNLVQRWLKNMNNVKPRTIRRLATLKSMLAALERHGRLEFNPLAGFRIGVKVGLSLPPIVQDAEFQRD